MQIDWQPIAIGICAAIAVYLGVFVIDAHSMDLRNEQASPHVSDMRGLYTEKCENKMHPVQLVVYKLCIYLGQGEAVACAYPLTPIPISGKVKCIAVVLEADKDA